MTLFTEEMMALKSCAFCSSRRLQRIGPARRSMSFEFSVRYRNHAALVVVDAYAGVHATNQH